MTIQYNLSNNNHRFLNFALLVCFVGLAAGASDLLAAEVAPPPVVHPARLGFDESRLAGIETLVKAEIEKGNFAGCVIAIGRRQGIGYLEAFGHRQLEPSKEPMTTDTLFDMASITKPVATATSVMLLVEQGRVRLRNAVSDYIPEFGQNGKEKITVEELLTHHGGLKPGNPLSDYEEGIEKAWERLFEVSLAKGAGTDFIYTDLGFLVLGELVYRVSGQTVAEFSRQHIFEPLNMKETGYCPPESLHARAATTEKVDGRWLKGTVHDPRAASLEGVAGHAGLFSTATDMATYATMMLGKGSYGYVQILSPSGVREMTRSRDIAGNLRGLGWDKQSKYSSNRGELFTSAAFGHGGFTGTAMWIDPELDLYVIFLSNRLHPDGKGNANELAGRIGTLAAAAIRPQSGAAPTRHQVAKQPTSQNAAQKPVLLGIDVLEQDGYKLLAGKKVGLITNHTGQNQHGRRTIDLLHEAEEVELVAIFSPEHGLEGQLDVSKIDDTREEKTNLPVYSLYGETRKPNPEHLEGIDVLVFDIQDIGCRFYTYISTMGLAMEAAAEAGLQFVVLDRPNPIGGVEVAGPMRDESKESFVAYHTTPVQHGMTIGELALMFKEERGWDLDLRIVEVENWRRGDLWDATGLTWVNPSPNMRSLTQAVIYPGIGLLETTNISVGRGTDRPFEMIGAPWIDGRELAAELNAVGLPGVRFVPIRFTPNASKFADEACEGLDVVVVDRAKFLSVLTGLEVARALRKLYPDDWEMKNFDRLLCSDAIFQAVEEEKGARQREQIIRPQVEEFLPRRAKFLIYEE